MVRKRKRAVAFKPFKRTHTMERLPMTPLEKLGEALETCIVACQGRRNTERAQAVLDVIRERGFDRDSVLEEAAMVCEDEGDTVLIQILAKRIRALKLVPPEDEK